MPSRTAEWYEREDAIMGTRIAVELWHDDPAAAERAIDAVIAEMHRIDELMSVYKEDSQVSRDQSRRGGRVRSRWTRSSPR